MLSRNPRYQEVRLDMRRGMSSHMSRPFLMISYRANPITYNRADHTFLSSPCHYKPQIVYNSCLDLTLTCSQAGQSIKLCQLYWYYLLEALFSLHLHFDQQPHQPCHSHPDLSLGVLVQPCHGQYLFHHDEHVYVRRLALSEDHREIIWDFQLLGQG